MRSEVAPTKLESPFKIDELFFSTTDGKGRITFGNNVFIRVSKFAADELLGEPHNIIRHPDMPRCVFRLLWDYLLKDKPIAAYVKNMAKDGSFYWVLAYVAPIEDGFLSIRLKPSGPIFEKVRAVYEELRMIEQQAVESGHSGIKAMDASTEKLLAILNSLGFADYDRFMSAVLVSEMLSRETLLKRSEQAQTIQDFGNDDLSRRRRVCARLTSQIHRLRSTLQSLLNLEQSLTEGMKFALTFGHTLRRITLNGRIHANALGDAAIALSEVAKQINGVSTDVAREGEVLGRTMSDVIGPLKTAAAEIASSNLSVEMMSLFLAELRADGAEAQAMQRNLDNLLSVISSRLRSTCECTEKAARELSIFEETIDHFVGTIRTLDMLYVCGRIECSRVNAAEFAEILRETVAAASDARERADSLKTLVAKAQKQLLEGAVIQREAVRLVA